MPILHSTRGIHTAVTVHCVHRVRLESQYYSMDPRPSFPFRLLTFLRVSHLAAYNWLVHYYIYRLWVVYTIIVRTGGSVSLLVPLRKDGGLEFRGTGCGFSCVEFEEYPGPLVTHMSTFLHLAPHLFLIAAASTPH